MQRFPIVLVTLVSAGPPSSGCESAGPAESAVSFDVSAMQPVIEECNRVFTNAHVIGDSAAMVDIFTADARVLPPDADPVIGRHAIEVLTAQYLTFGITEFREETTAFYGNQDMLIDEGTYVMVTDRTHRWLPCSGVLLQGWRAKERYPSCRIRVIFSKCPLSPRGRIPVTLIPTSGS